MSILPACTCAKEFGYVFGDYSPSCPRHGSTARWLEEKRQRREAELRNLRQQALTRPVHGGYPDAPRAAVHPTDTEALAEDARDALLAEAAKFFRYDGMEYVLRTGMDSNEVVNLMTGIPLPVRYGPTWPQRKLAHGVEAKNG